MRITILTLFPEMFDSILATSILKRSITRGLVTVDFVQIRDFAHDTYKHIDDKPFGGGAGMIMKCQPVLDALHAVRENTSWCVQLTPGGTPYTQRKAHELAGKEHLILLCGHYEGMDARIAHHMNEEISIGDYILTGGEVAAMVVMDSVVRLLKGAIKEESTTDESYEGGLLEYPQYTQPADYQGDCVPAVLTSGNHAHIETWRRKEALRLTREKRPDLFTKLSLSEKDKALLKDPENWEAISRKKWK